MTKLSVSGFECVFDILDMIVCALNAGLCCNKSKDERMVTIESGSEEKLKYFCFVLLEKTNVLLVSALSPHQKNKLLVSKKQIVIFTKTNCCFEKDKYYLHSVSFLVNNNLDIVLCINMQLMSEIS